VLIGARMGPLIGAKRVFLHAPDGPADRFVKEGFPIPTSPAIKLIWTLGRRYDVGC